MPAKVRVDAYFSLLFPEGSDMGPPDDLGKTRSGDGFDEDVGPVGSGSADMHAAVVWKCSQEPSA
jgi:hypothetical protein